LHDANEKPVLTMKEQKELEKLRAQDQREIKALKQELRHKEKALAEAAALLMLTKKLLLCKVKTSCAILTYVSRLILCYAREATFNEQSYKAFRSVPKRHHVSN